MRRALLLLLLALVTATGQLFNGDMTGKAIKPYNISGNGNMFDMAPTTSWPANECACSGCFDDCASEHKGGRCMATDGYSGVKLQRGEFIWTDMQSRDKLYLHVTGYAGIDFFSTGSCIEVFYMEKIECENWMNGLMVLDAQGTISRNDGKTINPDNYKISRGGTGYTPESPCAFDGAWEDRDGQCATTCGTSTDLDDCSRHGNAKYHGDRLPWDIGCVAILNRDAEALDVEVNAHVVAHKPDDVDGGIIILIIFLVLCCPCILLAGCGLVAAPFYGCYLLAGGGNNTNRRTQDQDRANNAALHQQMGMGRDANGNVVPMPMYQQQQGHYQQPGGAVQMGQVQMGQVQMGQVQMSQPQQPMMAQATVQGQVLGGGGAHPVQAQVVGEKGGHMV